MRRILLALLFLSCFDLQAQTCADPFNEECFPQLVIAHRGGYARGPENAIPTILDNIARGNRAVEIDVRITRDDELVIFHDATVERVLDIDLELAVEELYLIELKAIPMRDRSRGELYVPTLRELLDTLAVMHGESGMGDFLLELDFKPSGTRADTALDKLVEMLRAEKKVYGDDIYRRFFLSTFYPDVLRKTRERDPRIVTAFAVTNQPDKQKFLARMAVMLSPKFTRKYGARIIEPNMCMVTPRYVRRWQKRGLLINAWTANTACEKSELNRYPIAYTTNCPGEDCIPDPSDQTGRPRKWCKGCAKEK